MGIRVHRRPAVQRSATGGALTPPTQVFPRGHIRDTLVDNRDTLVDNRDVRLTVFVFRAGNAGAETRHTVEEGDFKNVNIDQRLDISPFHVTYLAYDFCCFNPSNGVVDTCEEHRPPGRTDADGDSHAHAGRVVRRRRRRTPTETASTATTDCWDQNATVYPGAKEIAGNAIDDDCAGGDAPARLTATIRQHGRNCARACGSTHCGCWRRPRARWWRSPAPADGVRSPAGRRRPTPRATRHS